MILIFGGAYQGKTEYAQKEYGIADDDIFCCDTETKEPDFSKKCITHLEKMTYAYAKEGKTAKDFFVENIEKLRDKVLIFDDISQGIVSIDPVERAWREMNGRCMIYLSEQADSVIRIFCGLGNKVK